jgi:hypothetical protein
VGRRLQERKLPSSANTGLLKSRNAGQRANPSLYHSLPIEVKANDFSMFVLRYSYRRKTTFGTGEIFLA